MNKLLRPIASEVGWEVTLLSIYENKMANWNGAQILVGGSLNSLREQLGETEKLASDLRLGLTNAKVASLKHYLTQSANIADVRNRVREVRETLLQELSVFHYLKATEDMVQYLDMETPFGKVVSTVFPQCAEDISEAHQCFAFGQYTAAAFHICRAMESVVRCVAKKMKVKASRDEWQSYISAMDEAIKKMPFKTPKDKAKRSIYSEASQYLFNFKEAFRNKTMHPKKTYTRKEALRVIEGASDFLQYVSDRLFRGRVAKS